MDDNPSNPAGQDLGVRMDDEYEIVSPGRRDLRAEARSINHLLTHLLKNPRCDVCVRAKLENAKSKATETLGVMSMGEILWMMITMKMPTTAR